jgi:hypothetical protein
LSQVRRYTYAACDPINNIDPMGQWSWEAFAIGIVSSLLAGVVCGGLVVGFTTIVGGFVAGAICSSITGGIIAGATA